MNDGRIQQIGTPEELYDNPTNFFVADFIGEPPMNFIKGQLIKENGIYKQKCENTEFILPAGDKKLLDYLNTETIMGIRPQFVEIGRNAEKNDNFITGSVFSYEYLGENGYLILSCEDINILIEIEHERSYEIGEKVSFIFKNEYICLFKKETGERIL